MRKPLLAAMGLQSLSPLLLVALTFFIARWLGAAQQGAFIKAKAWLDLLVAIGCFGFPQSIVLAVNRCGVSTGRLYRDAIWYSVAVIAFFVPFTALLNGSEPHPWVFAACMALGGSGVVLSNLWRGILLTVDDGLRFHLITVVPAVSLALTTVGALLIDSSRLQHNLVWAFGGAGLLCVVLSLLVFPAREGLRGRGSRPDYGQLVASGADVFVQALSSAAQTYLCYEILNRYLGAHQAGWLSIALMVFQACVMPLQMVSPLLFNWWSRRPHAEVVGYGAHKTAQALALAAALAGTAAIAAHWVVPMALGTGYQAAVHAVQLALFAVVPSIYSRIASLRLSSGGQLRVTTLASIVRLSVVVGALVGIRYCWQEALGATAAAACWLCGELAAAALLAEALRRARRTRAQELPA
ncbi:MAG: hypothetical protein JSR75_16145 [Proteobacteria bacterium]|nr:hypothetical protein [Pseudomonadota bacterium]